MNAIGFELEVAASAAAGTRHPSPPYRGPERRQSVRDPGNWMVRMLDEIDYGMLLVGADAELHYLNHAARAELDDAHPLQLQANHLRTQRALDAAPLQAALAAAQRGLRKLVTLGEGEHRVSVSVVPLSDGGGSDGRAQFTLLVLGKRQVCEQLSVRGFARSFGLTPAETRVLEQLCAGVPPAEIARRAGVKIATVRTQIGTARSKTGARSIRALVSMVAVLPPLVGALRCTGSAGFAGLAGFGTVQ